MTINSAISYFSAWIIIFTGLYALTRSTAGKIIIYYLLWLMTILLIVTHATEISNLVTPAFSTAPSTVPSPTTSTPTS